MKWVVKLMLCWMISFVLVELPVMKAHAGMISTSAMVDHMNRAETEKKVVDFMSRTEVQEQMVKLGVNPQEATDRVASMSDADLKKVSSEIDQSTAGGDIGGILVVVLLVVLIIYLVKRI